jgi:hypothetical protein
MLFNHRWRHGSLHKQQLNSGDDDKCDGGGGGGVD